MRSTTTWTCGAALLAALSGCDPKPDDSGATAGETTSAGDTGAPEDPTEASLAFGDMCLLIDFSWEDDGSPPPAPMGPSLAEHGPALSTQPACAGGACLFQYETDAPPCDDDGDCPSGGAEEYAGCSEQGFCALTEAWIAERTRCTETCEQDADCPAHPSCPGGYTCAPITQLGPLCCQSVCVCAADVSAGRLDQLRMDCAAGKFCPS